MYALCIVADLLVIWCRRHVLVISSSYWLSCVFVFQAEDGIRDLVRSRGLGDVYKRQGMAGLVR